MKDSRLSSSLLILVSLLLILASRCEGQSFYATRYKDGNAKQLNPKTVMQENKMTDTTIKATIELMKAEVEKLKEIEKKAHTGWVDLNRKIGKLETQEKKFAEILGESSAETLQDISKNIG